MHNGVGPLLFRAFGWRSMVVTRKTLVNVDILDIPSGCQGSSLHGGDERSRDATVPVDGAPAVPGAYGEEK